MFHVKFIDLSIINLSEYWLKQNKNEWNKNKIIIFSPYDSYASLSQFYYCNIASFEIRCRRNSRYAFKYRRWNLFYLMKCMRYAIVFILHCEQILRTHFPAKLSLPCMIRR